MTPPLVFMHGFLGAPDVWDPVIADLGEVRPIEKMTLPGHGQNPSQHAGYHAKHPWLVGYSLGGRMALNMIVRDAGAVAGAVLIGVNPGLRAEPDRVQRSDSDSMLARKLRTKGLEAFVTEWEAQPLFASQASLPASIREEHHKRRTSHTAEGVAWALDTFSLGRMPSLWDALKKNTIPLHLITGSLDEKFTAIAKEMVATIPNTTHTIVEGVGHDVVLERPAAVAAEIRAALKEHV